jgi:hypothetical protein
MKAGSLKSPALYFLTALWLGSVIFGMSMLWDYANRPGPEGHPPAHWPLLTKLKFKEGTPTLVMFAHPRCPCSRASLEELTRIHAAVGSNLAINVVFYHPRKFGPDWSKTVLWEMAKAIPGSHVTVDADMEEIGRFRPQTSGHFIPGE